MLKANFFYQKCKTKTPLSSRVFTLLLIPLLLLQSQMTLAQVDPIAEGPISPLKQLSCLSKSQQERIHDAFLENINCHQALKEASTPPPNETPWETIALLIIGGVAGGMVIENQLHH